MTNLQVFNFKESVVRTQFDENGNLWFCANDIGKCLGHSNSRRMVEVCKPNDVTSRYIIDSLGRNQEASFVSEFGLYRILFRSDLPNAEPFQDWLAEEVLPTIRKTGGYGAQQHGNALAEAKEKLELAECTMKTGKRLSVEDKALLHQTVFDILTSIRMPTEKIPAIDVKTRILQMMHEIKKSNGHMPDIKMVEYCNLVRSVELDKVQLLVASSNPHRGKIETKAGPRLNDGEKAEVMRIIEEHIYYNRGIRGTKCPLNRYEFFNNLLEMDINDKDGWLYDYRKHKDEVLALGHAWIEEKIPKEKRYNYLFESLED